jgi:hypothetical protein
MLDPQLDKGVQSRPVDHQIYFTVFCCDVLYNIASLPAKIQGSCKRACVTVNDTHFNASDTAEHTNLTGQSLFRLTQCAVCFLGDQ